MGMADRSASGIVEAARGFRAPRPLVEDFWFAWFGEGGRELGSPQRTYMADPKGFPKWIQVNEEARRPCYMSVNHYSAPNRVSEICEVFFEFDSKAEPPDLEAIWREAKEFADAVEWFYHAKPLVAFSGRRGFHVHVFLRRPLRLDGGPERLRLAYDMLTRMILRALPQRPDPSVVGDVKRLARIPYTLHEASGLPCLPVDGGCRPVLLTPAALQELKHKGFPEEAIRLIAAKVDQTLAMRSFAPKPRPIPSGGKLRPCIQEALKRPLDGGEGHLMRIAVVREYQHRLRSGPEEIVLAFSSQADYDPERSRFYVKRLMEAPGRPFRCETIRRLGYCLNGECPAYRRRFG
jgi:hypothetical protein